MSATTTTTCGMTTQRAAMVPGASKQRMEIMSRKVFGRRARVVRVAASAPNPPTVRERDDTQGDGPADGGCKTLCTGAPFSRFIQASSIDRDGVASRAERYDEVNTVTDGCTDKLDDSTTRYSRERDYANATLTIEVFFRAPLRRTGPTEPVWVCEGFGRG